MTANLLRIGTLIAAFVLHAHAAPLTLTSHRITWSGSMPIQTHSGTITPDTVHATVDNDSLTELRVTIDMASIRNEDIRKESSRRKLEGHLRSADFFHVDQFPQATFVMNTFDGSTLSGDLTIRGVTRPVTMPASLTRTDSGGWRLATTFTFNRQDFNVNYQNSGLFGTAKNKLIADDVTVGIDLTF